MSYIGQAALKNSELKRFDVTSSTSATHVLSWTAPNEQSLWITINGVKQQDDAYSIAGSPTTVTLTDALIATDKMEVIGVLDIGEITIVGDNTVSTNKLGDNSVTTAKIADDAVTAAKLAAGLANATHTGDVTGATALTIAADAVDIAMLSATGTASADTFLRGDNAWTEVSGGSSWQAVQTAAFTAVAGNGYPINTTASGFTVTLPASASVGDTIEFVDYAGTWQTNNIIVDPNSLKMKGATGNLKLKYERLGVRLVYMDATQGWVVATSRSTNALAALYSATGGDITQNGNYTVHTFLTSANFVVSGTGNVEIMCIAGAGGGGSQHSGGGGAGGYRYITGVATSDATYAIVVGSGGAGGSAAPGQVGSDGNVSSGLTYSSAGGGGGGSYPGIVGRPGGSGGGGGTDNAGGGSGNTPSTSPSQGNPGGSGSSHSPSGGGGGGGGSDAAGANGASGATAGGVGGAGTLNDLDGNGYYWAAGGGGAAHTGGTIWRCRWNQVVVASTTANCTSNSI